MSLVDTQALEANRNGRLASGQYVRVIFGVKIIMTAIFYLVAAGSIVGLLVTLSTGNTGALVGYAIPIFIGLLFGTLIGGNQIMDLLSGQVSHVEGDADRTSGRTTDSHGNHSTVLFYSVGSESFQVSQGEWDSLPRGHTVRAYFTPRSRTLVNVEPLQGRNSFKNTEKLEDKILAELDKKARE